MKPFEFDDNIDIFNVFGDDFDRFGFPEIIRRVTAGHGGESLLIFGSEKTALYDCGMDYCGEQTVANIVKALDGRPLDCIFLSHSHYDHIGALPYIKDRYPKSVVYASQKCADVLLRENARKLIAELGAEARDLYRPGSDHVIRTDQLHVDVILRDGDSVSLGDETMTTYETKGHTDCSLTYYLQPLGLLFTSESTGILEGKDYVHTPILKSFPEAIASSYKCEGLKPNYICLPHFGMLPQYYNDVYFAKFREECRSKMTFVRTMMREGMNFDEMLANYIQIYWTSAKEKEQPIEAFEINSGHILRALIRAIEEEGDVKNV